MPCSSVLAAMIAVMLTATLASSEQICASVPGLCSARITSCVTCAISPPASRSLLQDFFFFFALLGELEDHVVIFQRGSITMHRFGRYHLAQQPAHDFSAASLGQRADKNNLLWPCQGADFFRYPLAQLAVERVTLMRAGFQR